MVAFALVGIAAHGVRVGKFRIDFDRLAGVGDGLIIVASARVNQTTIVIGLEVFRVDLDCLGGVSEALIIITFAGIGRTSSHIDASKLRVDFDRLIIVYDGLTVVNLAPIGHAAAVICDCTVFDIQVARLDQARTCGNGRVGILSIAQFPILIALRQSGTGHENQQQR